MNPTILDRLFSLKSLSTSAEGVEWRFAHPVPAWMWVGIVVGLFVVAGWSYSRLLGSSRARGMLTVLRWISLSVLAVLIAGPELIRQNERVEKDWVVVMADRSASMQVADVPAAGGTKQSRESELRAAFATNAPLFAELAAKRHVLFEGFDSTAFDLRVEPARNGFPQTVALGEPDGRRTLIGQSLEQALRRIAARPVAGVVLFSDGRSPDQPNRALIRQLQARRIPIFPVPLGGDSSLPDLAIAKVDSPGVAFVGDMVPVTVDIESLDAPADAAVSGEVELVNEATGEVIDQRTLDSAKDGPIHGSTRRVTLLAKPSAAGSTAYTVRLKPSGPDLSAENNVATVRLEVADRPIRVVYFDGYPRWEYRYLKNILVREKSIKTSALLLASERRSIQDGNEILDELPRTVKAWQDFDVVIMGDVRPEVFSTEQLTQIRELVATRGAGLMWIGGSGATPGAWRGTPLADLIPFKLAADGSVAAAGTDVWLSPVLMKPAPAAERYGVLQLSENPQEPWPPELTNSSLGWPLMRWAQKISPGMLKPTVEVLATATPVNGSGGKQPDAGLASESAPLVMAMRYGAGRVVYVGTDETWRYRYCRGEVLTERFWIPMVRLLARESLGRAGKPATLTASPKQVQVGQQVQIMIRLLDQSLIEQKPPSLRVRLVKNQDSGSGASRPIEITLAPEGTEDGTAPSGGFSTTWTAGEPGRFIVEASDPLLTGLDIKASLEVIAPDDEMRFPQSDHASLAALAKETGGQVVLKDKLSELPELLPNRELRVLGVPDIETLWDKPIVLLLMMLLLGSEWLGRRLIKLA